MGWMVAVFSRRKENRSSASSSNWTARHVKVESPARSFDITRILSQTGIQSTRAIEGLNGWFHCLPHVYFVLIDADDYVYQSEQRLISIRRMCVCVCSLWSVQAETRENSPEKSNQLWCSALSMISYHFRACNCPSNHHHLLTEQRSSLCQSKFREVSMKVKDNDQREKKECLRNLCRRVFSPSLLSLGKKLSPSPLSHRRTPMCVKAFSADGISVLRGFE